MSVEVADVTGGRHPVISAEWLGRPGKPTLAIYGHYDVQPPDPMDEWKSPPFEPEVRDGSTTDSGKDEPGHVENTHSRDVEKHVDSLGHVGATREAGDPDHVTWKTWCVIVVSIWLYRNES